MIVRVELLAFDQQERFREVEILSESLDLDEVYHYGQNDFQPQQLPSVSVGDVIHYDNKKWLIMSFGFRELTEEEYREYKTLPRQDRLVWRMKRLNDI